VRAVGFDPRGRCLVAEATAITDEERAFCIRLWDLRAGKPVFAAAQSRKHEKEKKEQSLATTLFRLFAFRAFAILLNFSASLR
jgi:hypothetical protein